MTTVSPTLIAARYPLCLDDDTLMNDDQLIRYIRNRCGDEVADAITELIYSNSIRAQIMEIVTSMAMEASELYDRVDGIKESLDDMQRLVKEP